MTFGRIVRRSLLYVGLAVAFLIILSLIVALGVKEHISVPGQWFFLAWWTGALAYVITKESREYWRRVSFWLIFVCAMAAHLALFIPILRAYPEFRPIWFWPIVIVEAGIFGAICEMLLPRSTRRRSTRPREVRG